MASKGCNFCDKVGTQPITNDRTSFNYSCLEVKKKDDTKLTKKKKATVPSDEVEVYAVSAIVFLVFLFQTNSEIRNKSKDKSTFRPFSNGLFVTIKFFQS
jgi:hypothetical protein